MKYTLLWHYLKSPYSATLKLLKRKLYPFVNPWDVFPSVLVLFLLLISFPFLLDTEEFLAEGLRNENLSAGAKDNRDHILRGLQQIKARFV